MSSNPYPVDDRGYTTVNGAAEYTGVSKSYFDKARHFGRGPEYVQLGRAVRYSFAALDIWADSNRRFSTQEVA